MVANSTVVRKGKVLSAKPTFAGVTSVTGQSKPECDQRPQSIGLKQYGWG